MKTIKIQKPGTKIKLPKEEAKDFMEATDETELDIMVASNADDKNGVGNLIKFPISELLEIGRDESGDLYIICSTTEGEEKYTIFDYLIL